MFLHEIAMQFGNLLLLDGVHRLDRIGDGESIFRIDIAGEILCGSIAAEIEGVVASNDGLGLWSRDSRHQDSKSAVWRSELFPVASLALQSTDSQRSDPQEQSGSHRRQDGGKHGIR